MFTGIIEKTARVIGVADGPTFRRLTLANAWPDVRPAKALRHGVCLTVARSARANWALTSLPKPSAKPILA